MLRLYSASGITKLDECERAFGWRYVAGIKTPTHPAAALGTEVDDTQLQPFLRDGRPIDFSRDSGHIAASALAFLPPPKHPGLEVQKHFVIPSPTWHGDTHSGIGLQGYVDLWLPQGGLPLPENVPPTHDGIAPPIVADFKTTVDIGKWAKSPTTLSTDVQAMIYAFWAMYATRKPVVDLVWIYMQTRGARKASRKHLRVTAQHVADQIVKINDRALRADEIVRTVADPLQLTPNPAQCDAYGGCPYRNLCNLGPGEIADARAAQAKRERERKEMNNTTTQQPVATMGLLAKMKAKRDAQLAGTGGAPAPAAQAAPLGINPPESRLPPAPLEDAVPEVPAAAAAAPPTTEPAPAAAPKRGPGRPRKTPLPTPAPAPAAVEASAHVVSITAAQENPTTEIKEALENLFAEALPSAVDTSRNFASRVRVVWAKEKIQPTPYNDFEIGPFEADGFPNPGESIADASARLYAELEKFAEAARARKAASFAKLLSATGVGQ